MACWGKYGGRYGKKMGTNPTDSPECAELLLKAGANPDSRESKGKTSLLIAAQTGAKRSIKVLLDYGADINAINNFGSSAIHTSFYFGTLSCAKALLFHEFKEGVAPQRPNVEVLIKTPHGDFYPIESPVKRDCYKMW